MPRKSAAAFSVAPVANLRATRLQPPPGLPATVRKQFDQLVASVDARHFVESDGPLIAEYVAAITLARHAKEQMEKEGVLVGGKVSPWLTVLKEMHRSMMGLSMRLRLSPQSRIDARGAGRYSGSSGPRGIDALSQVGALADE